MCFFKKNVKPDINKYNLMWTLWEQGKINSPYKELLTYQSEINNGGHDQYFFNLSNNGTIEKDLKVLYNILPKKLKKNLKEAYLKYCNRCNEENDFLLEEYDDIFYINEKMIDDILEDYSNKL